MKAGRSARHASSPPGPLAIQPHHLGGRPPAPRAALLLAWAGLALTPACMSYRGAVGVAPALDPAGAGVVEVAGGLDMVLGPMRTLRKHIRVVDEDAPYHYGLGWGLRGRFGQEAAVMGGGMSAFAHWHDRHGLGIGGRAEGELLTLGLEHDQAIVGLLSPTLQAGPRIGFEGGSFELDGMVGYQIRASGSRSYPVAGVLLEATLGFAR
ncbi:MAG: hypothetical protein GXP62_16455 [Oligoflexia bacterium]|nr:hypothetical protein [Oligoflexia bacterium]